MSTLNGRISSEWINSNRPDNGLFRAYWTQDDNASLENKGLPVRYEWYYKDGKRADGISKGWHKNGQLKQEMTWKDGDLISEIHWYNDEQKWWEGAYKNKNKEGLFVEWYITGQKNREGTYKDNRKDGLWTHWYENGQKNFEVIYKEGLYCGSNFDKPYSGEVVTYYENGDKWYEGTYKNGKKDGLWIEWYDNGQKRLEETYKDGKKDGLYISWHKNGQKQVRSTHKDGKEEGVVILWKPDGQVERKDIYVNGRRDRPAGTCYEDYITPGEDEVHHKEYGPNHNPKNGKFRKHWSNGNLRYEWEYKNGKRVDGISRGWWPNGQLKQEWTWKDGRVNGLQTQWWQNGSKSWEGIYMEGPGKWVRVGKWTWWYEFPSFAYKSPIREQKYREVNYKYDITGKLYRYSSLYKNSIEIKHGLVTCWYQNGQKMFEGTFKDGKLDGKGTTWYDNGQIRKEGIYQNGKKIGVWIFGEKDEKSKFKEINY